MSLGIPLEAFLHEQNSRFGKDTVVANKSPVIPSEAQEPSELSNISWG